METMFVFQLSPMDADLLFPQVRRALKKRVELYSRARLSRMWKLTDRINGVKKAPDDVLKRRKWRQTFLGLFCLLAGMFLLIPCALEPDGLLGPLLVSIVAVVTGVLVLWRYQKKLLGVLCLLIGGVLLLGARGAPQELGPLLLPGAVGILLGLTALLPPRKDRYDREAEHLLQSKASIREELSLRLSFSPECMTLSSVEQTENGPREDAKPIPYTDLLYTIETEDLFLLAYKRSGILLQKKDLTEGKIEDFREFISTKSLCSLA